MNIQFCCHMCYSAVICLNSPKHMMISFSVTAYFHLLFLFADVVFPWFMYADITLELTLRSAFCHLYATFVNILSSFSLYCHYIFRLNWSSGV
jgi:hypothetical protein